MNLIALTPEQEAKSQADLQLLIQSGLRFKTLVIDPPWSFTTYSDAGKGRSADRHYSVKPIDRICALPVQQLADKDCVLLLWTTMPMLPQALQVVSAWGFGYKTVGFVWIKQNRCSPGLHWGMGFWTRSNAELCLLCTRGHPKRQATNIHQVIMSPVSEHSRKPEEMQTRAERLLIGPYLELYARRQRPGWTCWGAEVP
jgi:N6-adenosine-specific RNA methylase IME4